VTASHDLQVHRTGAHGFTIVELLVVLAAMGLLLSIAAPRYARHLDEAREVALHQDLHQMREAIDQFKSDQARPPASLAELVNSHYLREVPRDPLTQRSDTWHASRCSRFWP
jgi:general secretion pathway protein G